MSLPITNNCCSLFVIEEGLIHIQGLYHEAAYQKQLQGPLCNWRGLDTHTRLTESLLPQDPSFLLHIPGLASCRGQPGMCIKPFNYKEAPAIVSDRQTHDTNLKPCMCIKPSSITKKLLQLFLIGGLMIQTLYVYQAFFNYKEAAAIFSDRQTHDTNLICVSSLLQLQRGCCNCFW